VGGARPGGRSVCGDHRAKHRELAVGAILKDDRAHLWHLDLDVARVDVDHAHGLREAPQGLGDVAALRPGDGAWHACRGGEVGLRDFLLCTAVETVRKRQG
jgi:hypothetical protein